MNKLTQALMEELTVEYVKVGSLQIPESVVISWVIMLLLVVGSILLTRNLKVDHISKRQAALEALYSLGKNFFEGLLGKEGIRYVPYLMTVALYIACSNVIGVFGVKPPTKDLDVTAALALMSIVLIEYAGVRARGGAGFLKSLAAPTPIMTPMTSSRSPFAPPVCVCDCSATCWARSLSWNCSSWWCRCSSRRCSACILTCSMV